MKPKLLDLFCGAGGCTKGYQDAGFYVVGVDINPQPRYVGDEFIQADVMTWLPVAIKHGYTEQFAVIHASPPCQKYSTTAPLSNGKHPDLVGPVRDLLIESGRPYVIENVPGAPLESPLMLCGSMFPGLRVFRHRLFECRPAIIFAPAMCNHTGGATGNRRERKSTRAWSLIESGKFALSVVGNDYLADEGRAAMGIDWMPKKSLSQAIPPAYTRYIGERLLAQGVAG